MTSSGKGGRLPTSHPSAAPERTTPDDPAGRPTVGPAAKGSTADKIGNDAAGPPVDDRSTSGRAAKVGPHGAGDVPTLANSPADDNPTVALHQVRQQGSTNADTEVLPEPQPTPPAGGFRTDRKVSWHLAATGPIPVKPGESTNHRAKKIFKRTLSKIWGDSIFGWSAQAGFWCALSTAPMLLALLGSVGLVANWFGPDTINQVETQVLRFLGTVFDHQVVQDLLAQNVHNLLHEGQGAIASVGFVISLWAGSSAMSAFVEAITIAYCQHEVRHPAAERFFALGLYLIGLVFGIVLLPLAAIGPTTLVELFPVSIRDTVSTIVNISYYPVIAVAVILLVTTLYKVAPRNKHPWKRGLPGAVLASVVFLVAGTGLRIYVGYVTTHGLTYGALTVPVVYLLFYYFVSMAIISGAQFNNATLEYYPPRKSKRALRRWRRLELDNADAAHDAADASGTPPPVDTMA
ncbi:MAG: YihY/virulence factor BrkB family protein [Actinomycetota bacterium]|nr:YihY/virulence factor BrkB family protein [Actinomycetota bacterium]